MTNNDTIKNIKFLLKENNKKSFVINKLQKQITKSHSQLSKLLSSNIQKQYEYVELLTDYANNCKIILYAMYHNTRHTNKDRV